MSNSDYTIRLLEPSDYFKGFLDLINTFTRNPETKSYDDFCKILDIIHKQNSLIYVIEDKTKIISSIKLIIEQKLHNNFKSVLHLEDIVTHTDYRKQGLATKLIQYAIDIGKLNNCYKIVLCSNPDNERFYINQGFIKKGTEFSLYLN
jgi:glucosamine-phosphate N-acetyltransferase